MLDHLDPTFTSLAGVSDPSMLDQEQESMGLLFILIKKVQEKNTSNNSKESFAIFKDKHTNIKHMYYQDPVDYSSNNKQTGF